MTLRSDSLDYLLQFTDVIKDISDRVAYRVYVRTDIPWSV